MLIFSYLFFTKISRRRTEPVYPETEIRIKTLDIGINQSYGRGTADGLNGPVVHSYRMGCRVRGALNTFKFHSQGAFIRYFHAVTQAFNPGLYRSPYRPGIRVRSVSFTRGLLFCDIIRRTSHQFQGPFQTQFFDYGTDKSKIDHKAPLDSRKNLIRRHKHIPPFIFYLDIEI
jgi:hypothetical protein